MRAPPWTRFAAVCSNSRGAPSSCARSLGMLVCWASRTCGGSRLSPSVWLKPVFVGRKPFPTRRCIERGNDSDRADWGCAALATASACARLPALHRDVGALQLLRHEGALGLLSDQ